MDSRRHLLVVDDDTDTRMMLAAVLSEMGFAVTTAADGEEGLRYLYSEAQCDAVLTDVMMPRMSGVAFIRLVQQVRPGLPVAFVTGRHDGVEIALAAGAIPLLKPFGVQQRQALEAIWSEAESGTVS
jgi:CheY-like chemotaxis protein